MVLRTFSEKFTASISVLLLSVLSIFFASRAQAQVVGGTLSGTVSDQSGAVVPSAQISIKNVNTGVTRTATSDAAGFYTAPNLLPGSYEITASAPGFSTEVRTGLTLTVGAQQVVNLTLQVGKVTEQVQVAGEAPAVQLATSAISAEVNSTTVRELPLNGRDWTQLAQLQTGVNAVETQIPFEDGSGRGNRGFGAQLSISGSRPTQNNYRLDGVNINDHGNGAPGSVLGGNLGVDAIQEFSVITSNYSAEYGRTSGGVVNAITKSGTNQFHGTVYEFLRNNALDARNFFDKDRAPFRRNQFGGAAGGPIRKDRTFIFGDYEGIRQSKGITLSPTVPSAAARAGSLCSLCPPAQQVTVAVDPSTQKYLALYPQPNGPVVDSKGDKARFTFAAQQVVKEDYFTTRVDHKISEKDSLFGTWMYDNTPFTAPDGDNNVLISSHTNRQVIVLEHSHIFSPTFVNTFRLGYNRAGMLNFKGISAINPAAADKSLATQPGQNPARIFMSGFTVNNGGVATVSSAVNYWNSYQVYDDAFLTRGSHSLKFGFALERMDFNFLVFQNPGGTWRFGGIKKFLTNNPNSYESGLPTRISPRGMRQTIFGGYLQDDWRWRPNLTLNLGLRYEMATVLKEVQGKISNLHSFTDPLPFCQSTRLFPADCAGASPYFSNPTLHNFEPRAGFSWDPFRDGKMAVRGGVGLFDVLPLPGYFILQNNQITPFFQLGTVSNPGPSFPLNGTFFAGGAPLLGLGSLSASIVDLNPHRNYVMQWNLNVQREITPSLTATVGYVGSHGVHMLIRGDDGDFSMPTKTSAGYLFPCSPPAVTVGGVTYPCAAGNGARINEKFGSIRPVFWSTDSSYDALEVGLQKRMSHGFQLQGSYTWGKEIDNNSSTVAGDSFSNSLTTWFWFDPRLSRGVADFNVGQTLLINGTWQVPTPHSLTGPAGAVLGGWQLGSIFKVNNGVPFTPVIAGDPLGGQNNGSDTFGLPSRVAGCNPINGSFKTQGMAYLNPNCFTLPLAPASLAAQCAPFGLNAGAPIAGTCANLLGNGGRNNVVGPALVNLDFSVFKNNYIKRVSENFNVQFRAEFFNLLNHASFGPPNFDNGSVLNEDGTPGNPGIINRTVTFPREIQFALKIIW